MEAFLEAAVLAAVAAEGRDLTLLVVGAAVVHALCDAAAEEALQGNKNQAVDTYTCSLTAPQLKARLNGHERLLHVTERSTTYINPDKFN